MRELALNEALYVLKDFQSSNMINHILTLLKYESEESNIYLDLKGEFGMLDSCLLAMKNEKEHYFSLYIFNADSIEKKYNQYRYSTFSYEETIDLHNTLAKLFI